MSDRTDALGVPLSRLDWRTSECEDATIRRTCALAADAFATLGLTGPTWSEWVLADPDSPAPLVDVAHPTGTTRMSVDPHDGVVDVDCRVHDVDNLYVIGSSVFPTTGHANPNQTIVALAVRLADKLTAQN